LHVLRGSDLGRHLIDGAQFRARKDAPQICVVTQGEILVLARINDHGPEKLARLGELLRELVVVDINSQPVIEAYADIDVLSRRQAKTMGKNDLWIAACAVATRSVLLTTDNDFDHLHPNTLKVWKFDTARPNSWTKTPP
jgi:predicted nucleic acid-binding protein